MAVKLSRCGLHLATTDGRSAYFNYFWLRDNCSTSWDPVTRDREFDIFAEPDSLYPETASIEADKLVITWAHDGHVSHYELAWLFYWAQGQGRIDEASVPRRYWFEDHDTRLQRFNIDWLKTDTQGVIDWIEALLVDGITVVGPLRADDGALTELAELIGNIRPYYGGKYFDVKAKPSPNALSYTAKALEMHTDVPTEELPPGVQFLHCRSNSVDGGDSLFVDGGAVASDLQKLYPSDFNILSTMAVPFRVHHDTHDMRARQRIIELDENDAVSGVTMSQHMADVFDLPQATLDEFYPAYRRFGHLLQDPKYIMRFRMFPSDCLVFDNHRIVHGREAYDAASGERHIRGCYVDRGEMRSKYRALKGNPCH